MKPTISAEDGRKASSTISSSSSSSIIRRLVMSKSLGLWAAFIAGFTTHAYTRLRDHNDYWGKVNRMYNDYHKREEELDRRLSRAAELAEAIHPYVVQAEATGGSSNLTS